MGICLTVLFFLANPVQNTKVMLPVALSLCFMLKIFPSFEHDAAMFI